MPTFQKTQSQFKSTPRTWLITGAAGFIGSNLLEALLRLDQTVIGLDNFSTGFQHNLDEVRATVSADQWQRFTFHEGDIRDLDTCHQACADVDIVLHQAALESSLQVIGEKIDPDCLVLIETTVPPGTTEYVAYPIMKKAFEARALQPARLTRDALRNMGRIVAASKIALLGASYREDVGDTRYSGAELIVRKLTEMGADVTVHDPYVKHWWELEKQDTYPSPDHSMARFFRNQEKLQDLRLEQDLAAACQGADAVILAARHKVYLELSPDEVVKMAGGPIAVIDCFGILTDEDIRRYFELGCEVKGLGRGHVKRIKDMVLKS